MLDVADVGANALRRQTRDEGRALRWIRAGLCPDLHRKFSESQPKWPAATAVPPGVVDSGGRSFGSWGALCSVDSSEAPVFAYPPYPQTADRTPHRTHMTHPRKQMRENSLSSAEKPVVEVNLITCTERFKQDAAKSSQVWQPGVNPISCAGGLVRRT